jgi:hypothetical protein
MTLNNVETTLNTTIIQLNNMSSLINTIRQSKDPFQDKVYVYDSWRRQQKYYEMEIKKLKEEVRQMQETLDGF